MQVRALAVCRDWKASLDPRLWPLETLRLCCGEDGMEPDLSIAQWVVSAQPAVRSLECADFEKVELLLTLASIAPRTVSPHTAGPR